MSKQNPRFTQRQIDYTSGCERKRISQMIAEDTAEYLAGGGEITVLKSDDRATENIEHDRFRKNGKTQILDATAAGNDCGENLALAEREETGGDHGKPGVHAGDDKTPFNHVRLQAKKVERKPGKKAKA